MGSAFHMLHRWSLTHCPPTATRIVEIFTIFYQIICRRYFSLVQSVATRWLTINKANQLPFMFILYIFPLLICHAPSRQIPLPHPAKVGRQGIVLHGKMESPYLSRDRHWGISRKVSKCVRSDHQQCNAITEYHVTGFDIGAQLFKTSLA